MKKVLVLFFISIYALASVGATVHVHYCMNEYAGWSLTHDANGKCSKCGMRNNQTKGCCKDEHKQLKADTHQFQQKEGVFKNVQQPGLLLPQPVTEYTFSYYPFCGTIYTSPSPPFLRTVPIYLSNRVFRI